MSPVRPTQARHELRLPDLGLPGVTISVGQWLVEAGKQVLHGDRLLEVLAGSVTVDLSSPADGLLAEIWVHPDDELHVGQVLGLVLAPLVDHASDGADG